MFSFMQGEKKCLLLHTCYTEISRYWFFYFFYVSQCFEFTSEFLCYFILEIPKQLIIVGRSTLASNERKYDNFFYYFWGNGGGGQFIGWSENLVTPYLSSKL